MIITGTGRRWALSLVVGTIAGICSLGLPAAAQGPGGAPGGAPALSGKWAARAKKVDDLAVKQQKNAKDAKLKTQVVKESASLGHDLMLTPELPPYKYRFALKYLRIARKLDPAHKQASADIKQIEDVYRSMGRPIPQ